MKEKLDGKVFTSRQSQPNCFTIVSLKYFSLSFTLIGVWTNMVLTKDKV